VDVHTVAPLTPAEAQQWNAQFDALIHLAGEGTGPLIFAGDFNATLDHAPLRRLIGAGMRDAFAEAGHGSAASWPQYLPIMALDHVLVSDDIGVMSIANENDPGSDHRGQVAALSIRNQP
jgi:endonuclease/exonuclease/phosphatase (EEP) superfamily protein YafD